MTNTKTALIHFLSSLPTFRNDDDASRVVLVSSKTNGEYWGNNEDAARMYGDCVAQKATIVGFSWPKDTRHPEFLSRCADRLLAIKDLELIKHPWSGKEFVING
jgi:hypothetical protein